MSQTYEENLENFTMLYSFLFISHSLSFPSSILSLPGYIQPQFNSYKHNHPAIGQAQIASLMFFMINQSTTAVTVYELEMNDSGRDLCSNRWHHCRDQAGLTTGRGAGGMSTVVSKSDRNS